MSACMLLDHLFSPFSSPPPRTHNSQTQPLFPQTHTHTHRQPQQEPQTDTTPTTSSSFITTAPVQFKFIVPTSLVGALLSGGEGRHIISTIKQATGALIQFSRPGAASLNKIDRLMILSGQTVDSCTSALTLLLLEVLPTLDPNYDRIRSYFRSNHNGSNGSCSSININNTTGMLTLRLVIPSNCAGKVMGPGGEQIKSLSRSTGTSVIVESRQPNSAFTPFRVVSILAPTALSLHAAMVSVMQTVSQDEVRYFSGIKEITSVCFEIVAVPAGKVGVLLGPEGRHIKVLQDVLKVKLGIAFSNSTNNNNKKSKQPSSNSSNATASISISTSTEKVKYVSIWGPPMNVKVAKEAVLVATGALKHSSNSDSSEMIEEQSPSFAMVHGDHIYVADDDDDEDE